MVRACGVSRPQDNHQLLHVRVSRREVSLRTETGIGHTWKLEVPSYIRCISIRARRDLSGDCAQFRVQCNGVTIGFGGLQCRFWPNNDPQSMPSSFSAPFPMSTVEVS